MFTPEIAQKIYLDGFPYKNRKLKLFSYSRILEHGEADKKRHTMRFNNTISFYFSCPLPYIVDDFISNAFATEEILLNGNNLILSTYEPVAEPNFTNEALQITMLSPMVAYSTFEKGDKKLTHYYTPTESEFQKLVEENAKRKYAATMTALGTPIDDAELLQMRLTLTPKKYSSKYDKKIVYFKNKVVEGYTGNYMLEGAPELIKITYDCGIGASTPEGFGMWSPL
jgi:CRISPR-associated endoribonuclease Cas6